MTGDQSECDGLSAAAPGASGRGSNDPIEPAFRVDGFLILTVCIFLVSRIVYLLVFGVRFDADPLRYYWQYVDPVLLQTDLLRSVFYLHSQPPLFNLYLGVVLKLFPVHYPIIFGITYLLLGFVMTICLYRIMRALGVGQPLAATLTALFMVSSSVLLYESWLFYTYPVVAFLSVSVVFLIRFLRTRSFLDGFLFAATLAVICLTRSLFHIIWFTAAMILLLYCFEKRHRTKAIAACALPFVLVLAVYVKNAYVFGNFSTATAYIGQNFNLVITSKIPAAERQAMIERNEISPLAEHSRMFRPIPTYLPHVTIIQTGVPVLDDQAKSRPVPGQKWLPVNAHHRTFIEISEKCRDDAFAVIRKVPLLYARTVAGNVIDRYFLPPTQLWPLHYHAPTETSPLRYHRNAWKLKSVNRAFDLLVYGQYVREGAGIHLLIGTPVLIVFAVGRCITLLRARRRADPAFVACSFMLLTVLFVTAASFLMPYEHNRFRFNVEPFYLIFLAMLITQIGQWVRARRVSMTR